MFDGSTRPKCDCGNEYPVHLRKKNDGPWVCDQCGDFQVSGIPDVYFDKPYWDEHLADEKNPHGHFITGKRQKAEVMHKLGLHEVGDRIKGSRVEAEKNHYGERKRYE